MTLMNICGCGSSGTTLLSRVLDRHPEIACGDELFLFCSPILYENYALFRRWVWVVALFGLSSKPYHQGRALFRHAKAYGLTRSTLWRWASRSAEFGELIRRVETHVLKQTGKSIWVEKTPRNIRVIGHFLRAFPQAKVIHIIRDPRDVILSLQQRGKSVLHAAETWLCSIASIQPYRNRHNVLEVHYEELCRQPDVVLSQVCSFLDCRYKSDYFHTDQSASKSLDQFSGHPSWSSNPMAGFSTQSIGQHHHSAINWTDVGQVRLTADYAALLGTDPWKIAELAQEYGYDFPTGGPYRSDAYYRQFDSEWRLDPLRRLIDRTLDIKAYVPMVEFVGTNLAGNFKT